MSSSSMATYSLRSAGKSQGIQDDYAHQPTTTPQHSQPQSGELVGPYPAMDYVRHSGDRAEHRPIDQVSAIRSTLDNVSAPSSPQPNSPAILAGDADQDPILALLNDTQDEYLMDMPGKKRGLNSTYQFPMLDIVYDASKSRLEHHGHRVPDYNDPVPVPWAPSGSPNSSLAKAHIRHKTKYELEKARKRIHPFSLKDPYVDQPQEQSWIRKQWVNRLPMTYNARMREWSKIGVSAPSTPTEPSLPTTEGASETASLRPTSDSETEFDGTLIEPLRKIIRNPASRMKPVGNPLEQRQKVFNFALCLRDYCVGEPSAAHALPSDRIESGEEYDIVDAEQGNYDELESLFDVTNRPIGVFDKAEVDVYCGTERCTRVKELQSAGATPEEIRGIMRAAFGRGIRELDEELRLAKEELVSQGKMMPQKFVLKLKRKRSPPETSTEEDAADPKGQRPVKKVKRN